MEDTNLMKISLSKLRFFGQYGLYEVEKKWLGELELDLEVLIPAPHYMPMKLADTVDYQYIYDLAAQVFSKKEELIENLAYELLALLKSQIPQAIALKIQVYKKPILKGPNAAVSVCFSWNSRQSGDGFE